MSSKFDLALALAGSPVTTKDGRTVTNIQIVNPDAPRSAQSVDELRGEQYVQGLTAVIHNLSGQHTYPFYHDGGSHLYGGKTEADLVMA